jgi:PAS domain S-box-containing protein
MNAPVGPDPDRGTILVVDDEPDILVALEDLFEAEYRVLKATTPLQALEILRREPNVAIIISDQRMPEMQGDEFLARARGLSNAESILLTGYADLKAVIGAVNNGRIMAYVPKPWDSTTLSSMVASAYERHRLSQRLETERTLLRGLMESTVDRIAFKDLDGRFMRLNGSKARSLGITVDEGIGLAERAFVPPDRAAIVEGLDREAIAAAHPTETTDERPGEDGTQRWTLTQRIPILDAGGSVTSLASIERDITERKLMEVRLRQADKMQALGTLAGGVAHDFNNLLMAVLGSLDLASRRLPDDPRLSRLLQNAIYAAERGASLTQRLLSFSRQRDLRLQSVDVTQVIRDMDDLLSRTLGTHLRIDKALAGDLWCATVDPAQLELAILNLCINARDAMPESGTLTLATRNATIEPDEVPDLAPGEYVVVSVSDTGLGMTPEVLNRVFEPFFTTKEVGKGTGLGLPMVYGLAQQSGGTVTITSAPGQGTRVDLYLARSATASTQATADADDTGTSIRKAHILLVDDDAEVRSVTAAYLVEMGHSVTEASSGEAALRIIGDRPQVDLLVADFAMPEMTGLELSVRAKNTLPNLRTLLVTGYADPEKVPEGYPVLNKPFGRKDLAAQVSSLIAAPGA